ncbi:Hsp20/alpha crystallin family protein [Alicyclobacillus fastidiosus]|uniref:Hsp20/alpha crystallin family protein n=1 Tax=Alicyclobacillus fastidiosus TaxID=392011 RepID=A0ABV5A9I7_9BACL|nr:Hsp20/alpha crystallin family protein [Alicyclobacillus fastidiosus]WEH10796.1 Hsp20/alpha crystallin family protein [Alicyclobacillus fastidiosus]
MAPDNTGNNPFDLLKNLGNLGDFQKFLGEDFFKNIPIPNMPRGGVFDSPQESHDEEFPSMDLYSRGNDQLIAVFEIPGLTNVSDVRLSVRSNILTVRGTITARFNHRDDTVLMSECHHGSFQRKVELPAPILADSVQAVYKSGLLIVYLTKDPAYDNPDSMVPINFE